MKSASQMKLNPSLSPDEVGFHHGVISSTAGGFIPSNRTDFVEKNPRPADYKSAALPTELHQCKLFNEIAQRAMKSEQARMKSASQMKLNPPFSPDEVGFHHGVISSHRSGIYSGRKDGFS